MGRSVDLYFYNYKRLKNKIMETYNLSPTDEKLLEDILLGFGTVINDRYIILCNEFWEDGNPYFNVATAIERAFKLGEDADVFGECFIVYGLHRDDDYKQDGINYAELYDVLDSLGIEYDDDDDDDDE